MRLHGNAELSLNKRRRLATRVQEGGWTLTRAAAAAEVSVCTARKWARRYRSEGEAGLLDRSSRPHSSPNATPEQRVALIALLRRSTRMTGAEIAEVLAMPITTVQGILTRIGLGKRSRLDREQVVRYERSRPGELIHIDVKKLGRIERGAGHRVTGRQHYTPRLKDRAGRRRGTAGWECCHVAIDDFSRLAYVEVLGDERAVTAIGFLRRALRFYADHGVTVERVLTDNGSAYVSIGMRSPAGHSASDICALVPAVRRPMARPSVSSARCSTAGPTDASMAPARNAPPRSPPGSTSTITADHTAPSAATRPSAGSAGTTSSGLTASGST